MASATINTEVTAIRKLFAKEPAIIVSVLVAVLLDVAGAFGVVVDKQSVVTLVTESVGIVGLGGVGIRQLVTSPATIHSLLVAGQIIAGEVATPAEKQAAQQVVAAVKKNVPAPLLQAAETAAVTEATKLTAPKTPSATPSK